eukprot:jgi/Ulvmu1/4029/UM019_0006.1
MVHTEIALARSPASCLTEVAATRVKLSLSPSVLQKYHLQTFWKQFWFVVPPGAFLIADVLPLVWASMQLTEDPTVQLFCERCYIPTHSNASLLRDGDVIDVTLWGEGGPVGTEGCTQGHVLHSSFRSTDPKAQQEPPSRAKQPSRNARRKKLKRQMRRQGLLHTQVNLSNYAGTTTEPPGPQQVCEPTRAQERNPNGKGPTPQLEKRLAHNAIQGPLRRKSGTDAAWQMSGNPVHGRSSARACEARSDENESSSVTDGSAQPSEDSSDSDEPETSSEADSTSSDDDSQMEKQPFVRDEAKVQRQVVQPASRCHAPSSRFADASSSKPHPGGQRKSVDIKRPRTGQIPQAVQTPATALSADAGMHCNIKLQKVANGSGVSELRQAAIEAFPELITDPLGICQITSASIPSVLMYKVAEIGPQRLPWISDWRFGKVTVVEGMCIVMSPWPEGSEHPLATAWKRFHGVATDDPQAHLTEDMEERLSVFIASSANYDPATGIFEGELGLDIVSARFTGEEATKQCRAQRKLPDMQTSGPGTGSQPAVCVGHANASSDAELQVCLDREQPAELAAQEPAPSLTPQQRSTQVNTGIIAPARSPNAGVSLCQPHPQLADLPLPASPHGQTALAYDSQKHFVDVLRQLEARKAELRGNSEAPHTWSPDEAAACAPTAHGGGPSQETAQHMAGAASPGKRSASTAMTTGQGQKQLRLARGGARQAAIGPVLAMLRNQQSPDSAGAA